MEKNLQEGQYLAAGVKEVPIPFTQDPTLKADKEDMNVDSEILKGGELRDQVKDDQDQANGKHDKKGSVNKKAAFGGGAAGTDGMTESYNEFKVGDTVCLNNIKNREWIIESIQINEDFAKFGLRSGQRRMIVRPDEMLVEHIEGVEIHRERFEDSVISLRNIYENMEINSPIEATIPEEPPVESFPENTNPVMERKALYAHIKEQGLHTNGDRGAALQQLGATCSNEMEEIHSVYEDACLSLHNQNIDEAYGYVEAEYNENNAGLIDNLTTAYESMLKAEIEETAKINDEEGDRSKIDNGLVPNVNLGF
jgi:hypothetical protein